MSLNRNCVFCLILLVLVTFNVEAQRKRRALWTWSGCIEAKNKYNTCYQVSKNDDGITLEITHKVELPDDSDGRLYAIGIFNRNMVAYREISNEVGATAYFDYEELPFVYNVRLYASTTVVIKLMELYENAFNCKWYISIEPPSESVARYIYKSAKIKGFYSYGGILRREVVPIDISILDAEQRTIDIKGLETEPPGALHHGFFELIREKQ